MSFCNILLWVLVAVLQLTAAPVLAADIDTLFTSPAERKRLDDIRYGKVAPTKQAKLRLMGKNTLHFNGLVQRADGKDTVWVEDRSVFGGAAIISGIRVDPAAINNGGLTISLPGKGTAMVKPGQQINIRSGSVQNQEFGSYQQTPDYRSKCITRKRADGQTEIRC